MKLIPLIFCAVFVLFPGQPPAASPPAGAARNSTSLDSSLLLVLPPLENVAVMYEKFQPLKEKMERALSRTVVVKVAKTYEEAIESIGTGRAHLAYLDPAAYCEAKHRYRVIPLAKSILSVNSHYSSVIVARKDSPINKIVESRGKRLALGSRHSSSSYLLPAVMFKEVGIELRDFRKVDFLEQEDRIALSVLTKRHDLGGLSEHVARKYLADGLKIVKASEPIPQFVLCAGSQVPVREQSLIRQTLLSVPGRESRKPGQSGFVSAEDRDFDVVRVMIRNLDGTNYVQYGRNTIKVAILPLYSAITLFDRFDPLMRYLSKRTGSEFKLVIPRDFEDFFEIIKRGEADFSYSNPYIYIQLADSGHVRAFATTVIPASGDIFRGIIITHRDSPVRAVRDLKGADVMIVSYKSAGGFLAQQLFLKEQGIDVFRDLRLREGKRQEEVILSVYRRQADAGFVRESALDVLKEEIDLDQVRILAATPYIANWPFAATRAADQDMTSRVRALLLDLKDRSITTAARVQRFKAADDSDFNMLRGQIRHYEEN
jgi:phosphonate transport system substrate-binding protein